MIEPRTRTKTPIGLLPLVWISVLGAVLVAAAWTSLSVMPGVLGALAIGGGLSASILLAMLAGSAMLG